MQHLCGFANMIVSPEGALVTKGDTIIWQHHRDVAFVLLYRTTYHAVL